MIRRKLKPEEADNKKKFKNVDCIVRIMLLSKKDY